ncbi:MAG: helix-turn-helix transcriptional regulator [Chitinophagaceae bacterium]|nr:helix-turn-helix transcriptional regulator [Chitinophagaceae bacterium]
MSYIEYLPAKDLQDHLDAYWIRKTPPGQNPTGRRVYADGCADLILNTGTSTAWFNPMARAGDIIPFDPGHMYLGGTMTEYGVVTASAGCILTGIRFRPGGFYAFYRQPMAPAVDSLLPFTDPSLQPLMEYKHSEENFAPRLDTYFIAKKIAAAEHSARTEKTRDDFNTAYKTILLTKGQISVEALSKECHMSRRTMERVFKENVGIPPKEFIRIARFQEVLSRLRQTETAVTPRESLLRIAFELGYHDHAHLTNEFKQYAGILPSELSRFYKTGIASGNYF